MNENVSNFALKETVTCPCSAKDCPKTGTSLLKGTGHIRNCPNTCPRCRGKRSREKGKRGERDMRKQAGVTIASNAHAAIGEEAWSSAFRWETKSGKQVNPIATRFLLAEKQSEGGRPVGDVRPFGMMARPDGMPGGLVLVRGSVWRQYVLPALMEFYGEEAS